MSSLALGHPGCTQRTNFLVTGLAMLALAAALRRVTPGSKWEPGLVGGYAVGLIGAGVFVPDPIRGYAPDSPTRPESPRHVLHGAFSLLVFGSLIAAAIIYARHFAVLGDRSWAVYSAASGTLVMTGVGLFGRGFAEVDQAVEANGLAEVGGLIHRLTIAVGWGWITALAIHLAKAGRPDDARSNHRKLATVSRL